MNIKIKNIAVIGDGGWGTTLSVYLAKKGHSITLWGPFPDYVKQMSKTRVNSKFLPGFRIPQKVKLTSDLKTAITKSDLVVLAIPSEYIVDILKKLKPFDFSQKIILSVIKGIHTERLKRISQLIHEELGNVHLAVLSGPTIAKEVALGIPTTAVIACHNTKIAQNLQKIFNSKSFRIYTNDDIIGVELGGSVKNIIAIASGVCDGLKLGTNTKAAILARGLAEMARLGQALGAKKETFAGLTGLGDLATTCMSQDSRNRHVGEELGKGKTIRQITSSKATVAEGVPTAKAVYRLSQKLKVSMPITTEVYNIIYKRKNPQKALLDLMARQPKAE